MTNQQTVQVYIVDDEPSVCTAYARLVRLARMQPRTFASVDEFIRTEVSDKTCLERADLITTHDTPETRDQAQKSGVAAYSRKPVDDQALFDAIAWALTNVTEQ